MLQLVGILTGRQSIGANIRLRRSEKPSNKTSNIIGVIDEIAFQAQLLALNAGVEAAAEAGNVTAAVGFSNGGNRRKLG